MLSFEWGVYQFQGVMESFKETIDFFSADGIPLRALVSIGLARQDKVFDPRLPCKGPHRGGQPGADAFEQRRATSAATGGDPNATRASGQRQRCGESRASPVARRWRWAAGFS